MEGGVRVERVCVFERGESDIEARVASASVILGRDHRSMKRKCNISAR